MFDCGEGNVMPIYEYQCSVCKRTEERFFGSHEHVKDYELGGPRPCRPNPKHGKCTGTLARKPSAPAFAINGFSEKNGYASLGREG